MKSIKRRARRLGRRLGALVLAPTQETLGVRTNYNLYRLHPLLRLTSKGHFLSDTSPNFPAWLERLSGTGARRAVILGNAPCLNELTNDLFEGFRREGLLTIGLNRSIYNFQTDLLLWSDLRTIDDILKRRSIRSDATTVLHVLHERDHRLPARDDEAFQDLHRYWSRHRNFRDWPKVKLFMFRNVAIGALHLCYRLGIKDILMVGFGFDDRGYFYKTDNYKHAHKYEVISDERLAENCGGYDTQRIVREVLEYLIQEEGFRIQYNGDSKFLSTVAGMEKAVLASLADARQP